jgi:hypothetical protein
MCWGIQHFAKKDTWFKCRSIVRVLDDYGDGSGLFCGRRICQNPESEIHSLGEEYHDEEMCSFDEFVAVPLWENLGVAFPPEDCDEESNDT